MIPGGGWKTHSGSDPSPRDRPPIVPFKLEMLQGSKAL